MMGLAWASCWPGALQAARENQPALFLLGAGFALLPDTLDQWIAPLLHKPEVHIVTAPENPDPDTLAGALAHLMVQSHHSGRPRDIVCYPIPIARDQWLPYSLHFDRPNRKFRVTLDGTPPLSATAPVPVDFTTDSIARLRVHRQPLSLRVQPGKKGRMSLIISPSRQQWSHSLILAAGSGVLVAGLLGLSAGLIAAGAYFLSIFSRQWGFRGSALLWPFKPNRYTGLQWVKPHQSEYIDLALLWLSLLLLTGNILHSAAPAIEVPSRFQILLVGSAIPLALTARFRLNGKKGRNQEAGIQEHT